MLLRYACPICNEDVDGCKHKPSDQRDALHILLEEADDELNRIHEAVGGKSGQSAAKAVSKYIESKKADKTAANESSRRPTHRRADGDLMPDSDEEVRQAEEVLRRSLQAKLQEAHTRYEEAARIGHVVHAAGAFEAARYYGLHWGVDCDTFERPGSHDAYGATFAVVPRPGAPEPVSTPERSRRAACKRNRALRREVFKRLRRFAAYKENT